MFQTSICLNIIGSTATLGKDYIVIFYYIKETKLRDFLILRVQNYLEVPFTFKILIEILISSLHRVLASVL